jgi:hypothetical protein
MIFQINFYFSIITKIKIKTGKFGPGNPLFLNAVEGSLQFVGRSSSSSSRSSRRDSNNRTTFVCYARRFNAFWLLLLLIGPLHPHALLFFPCLVLIYENAVVYWSFPLLVAM